ncbi:MAG: hypothetical protein ACE5J7_01690 [Candidatus Aenigmatarchaeota archaeon]
MKGFAEIGAEQIWYVPEDFVKKYGDGDPEQAVEYLENRVLI